MGLNNWVFKQNLGTNDGSKALCKRSDGSLLAGSSPDGQIWKSDDHGEVWQLYSSLPAVTRLQCLLYAALGNVVLAGGGPSGVIWRSSDNGLSYAKVLDLGSSRNVFDLLSPQDLIFLAAAGEPGMIYRSATNGTTWTQVFTLTGASAVWCLEKVAAAHVLAGTGNGGRVYRSTDTGRTWPSYSTVGSQTAILALRKIAGGPVLAGTYPNCQIWSSDDEGVTWDPVQSFGPGTSVLCIRDLGSGVVLVGTDFNGQIWVSTTYGRGFTLLTELGSGIDVRNFLFDSPSYIVAGTTPLARIFGCALYISPPIAAFSAAPLAGDVPLSVQFTDESTNAPATWLWDFGDGETSTEQSPLHIYVDAGTYTVSLTVHNYAGTDTETKIGLISATSVYKRFTPIWTMKIGTL